MMVEHIVDKRLDSSVVRTIASSIKGFLSGVDEKIMHGILISHYKKLHLLDKNGSWVSQKLGAISDKLLPDNISEVVICDFVDKMVDIAERNEYLMHFFEKSLDKKYPALIEKLREEGIKVIPDVVGFAIVLQNLTKACAEDYKVLDECYKIFRKARLDENTYKSLPFFHKIKLISVEIPIKTYIRYHETGVIPPSSGKIAVTVNILEATLTDFLSGNIGNALTGWALAKNKAGKKKHDPVTGEGPSGWSESGKMVERAYPLPTKWADLYQTWNMAFVTRFPDFPYILPKLFIPQVASYQQKPKEYIYNRAIALYMYLNFASFDYAEKIKNGEEIIQWFDRSLNLDWGKLNAEMANQYELELKEIKRKARERKT